MKLSLGKKLALGFGCILTLMVFSAAMTYRKSAEIKQAQDLEIDVRFPTLAAAKDLQRDLNQTASKARQAILAGAQPSRKGEAKKAMAAAWSAVDSDVAHLNELAPKWSRQENRDRLMELERLIVIMHGVEDSSIALASSKARGAIVRAGNECTDRGVSVNNSIKESLGNMVDSIVVLADQSKEELRADDRALILMMALTTLAALGMGSFVAVFLSRSVSVATQAVLAQAKAIAAGDLTGEELVVESQDELGELTAAINQMSGSLKRMIVAIMDNSAHVASASEELSSSATLQAQGADTQKDQTTQVATAMQEMAATVHEVSENSQKAADASHNAAQAARQGGQVVQETLATMRGIAESTRRVAARITELGKSSEQIGRIIAVIDDIADQTNLLALNAAIEAARTGEQGRGFAVVADEVRKLAERTAQATKEIAAG